MPFDSAAFAQKSSMWFSDGEKIAGAASRIYAAYLKLEPTAKVSVQADLKALKAAWQMVDSAFDEYDKANPLSKVAAGMAVVGAVATAFPILTSVADDGEVLFGSDWPVIQPDVAIIFSTLKGPSS